MTQEQFAQHIAGLVGVEEIAFCRQLGMSERDATRQAFRVLDETYIAVFAADRPMVLTRFRPMAG